MKKFYKDYDESYYTERKYYSKKHVIKYVKSLLKNKEDIKWLDIGCGLGYLTKEAIEEGIDAYGIEVSSYALKNAITRERVKFGSITDIPFEDNYFDIVSAFDILEHIYPKDTFKALSEIRRVLRSRGAFIMTTPDPCTIGDWIYALTHINVRPSGYRKQILEKYGFKVKLHYIPSFLKYYVSERPYFLHKLLSLIPENLEFKNRKAAKVPCGLDL